MKSPIWYFVLMPLAVVSAVIITIIAVPFIVLWGFLIVLVTIGICFKKTLETISGTIEDKLS